jgi:hypothetical protein
MAKGEIGPERTTRGPSPESLLSITHRTNLGMAAQVGEAITGQLKPYDGDRRITRIDISVWIHRGGDEQPDIFQEGRVLSIARRGVSLTKSSSRLALMNNYDGCCEAGDFWGDRIGSDSKTRPDNEFSPLEEVAAYSLAMPRPKDKGWFAYSSLQSVATKVLGEAVKPVWVERPVKPSPVSEETAKYYPALSAYIRNNRRPTIKNALEVSESLKSRNNLVLKLQQAVIEKYQSFIESGDKCLDHLSQFDSWLRKAYPGFNSDELVQVLHRVEPYIIKNPDATDNYGTTAGWVPEVRKKEKLPDVDEMAVWAVKTRFVLDELREDYKYKTDIERANALRTGQIEGVAGLENQKTAVLAKKLHEADGKLMGPIAQGLQDPAIAPARLSMCVDFINSDPFFAQFDGITKLMILSGSVSVDQLRIIAVETSAP